MADRYHLNPETGATGKCSASRGKCPFGGEELHHASAGAARLTYEASQGASFQETPPLDLEERTTLGAKASEAIYEAMGEVMHYDLDESELSSLKFTLDDIMAGKAWREYPSAIRADLMIIRMNLEDVGHGHNGHWTSEAGLLTRAEDSLARAQAKLTELIDSL